MMPTPPRLRSAQAAVGVLGFFGAVNDALKLQLKIQDWPVGTTPTLVHEFPQERLAKPDDPFDVITFGCGGAKMAATDNEGNRVPIRPLVVEKKDHPTKAGYVLETLYWREMTVAVFTVWSKSNVRADAITEWFHRFMMVFGHVYRFFDARGVERFKFLERGRDESDRQQEQELYRRSLAYEMRLQYLVQGDIKTLDQLTVNLGIGESQIETLALDTQSR